MPDWSKQIQAQLAGAGLQPEREAEIVEELGQHLTDRYEELVARGAAEDEAYRAVIAELGGGRLARDLPPALSRERPSVVPGRDEPVSFPSGVWTDLRHGVRLLRRDPGFSIVAILSLALGIGANTAIFQLLDAVRLRTLPVEDPRRLVNVKIVDNPFGRVGGFRSRQPEITTAIWERLAQEQQAFSSIAAWSSQRLNLAPGGEARYAEVLWVSGSFFQTLGVRPARGRLLSPSDDRRGCGAAGVVMSDPFWRREFGGAVSALGARLSIEGRPFEVIGVTPPGFFGVEVGRHFDVALPLCSEPTVAGEKPRTEDRQQWWLAAIGRLKPGWTIEKASAQMGAISRGIFGATLPQGYDEVESKRYRGFRLGAVPAASGWSELRQDYTTPLWLLLSISGLVLLIACANLANLMLARATARQRDIAIRLALGASRGRLIRQLLAESLVLAVVGAACGAAMAQALIRVLVSYLSTDRAQVFVDLSPDLRVLSFTAALAVATCVVFGLAPAIQASRAAPNDALKSGARSLTGSRVRFGARRALVVSQVSLSLVLLVGALLFVRTFRNLTVLDAGFRRDKILMAEVDFGPLKIPVEARVAYRRELLDGVRRIPGVLSAASFFIIPASGEGWNDNLTVDAGPSVKALAYFNRVGPGYFRTMETPLLAGRDFSDSDRVGSPLVAIVAQKFARKFLSGANPIGRSFTKKGLNGQKDRVYSIVGLVKDSKYNDLREEFTPIVFLPDAQDSEPELWTRIAIRSDQPPAAIVSSVKRLVAERSPAIVLTFREFGKVLDESLLRERLMASLSGFFGALAAILAMVGLYGVISYMVVRRRNEIGVRMALGAGRRNILAMVLKEAGVLLAVGVGIGAVLSIAAAGAARSLLFGLKPGDPGTLALAAAGLSLIAVAASLLPAQRAASLDPVQALRED